MTNKKIIEGKMVDGERIENILEKSWGDFKSYYDEKAGEYSNLLGDYNKAKDEHWICWDEDDLMVQIGRFFYKQIEREPDYRKIELHFNKKINKNNFEGYTFEGGLPKLKEKLGRTPKVDLIITQEDYFGPFLLCAEAKHFHYPVDRFDKSKTVKGEITKDIDTLRAIKEFKIAEKIAFILFDDFYYLHGKQNEKQEIKKITPGLHGINVLYHDTQMLR